MSIFDLCIKTYVIFIFKQNEALIEERKEPIPKRTYMQETPPPSP